MARRGTGVGTSARDDGRRPKRETERGGWSAQHGPRCAARACAVCRMCGIAAHIKHFSVPQIPIFFLISKSALATVVLDHICRCNGSVCRLPRRARRTVDAARRIPLPSVHRDVFEDLFVGASITAATCTKASSSRFFVQTEHLIGRHDCCEALAKVRAPEARTAKRPAGCTCRSAWEKLHLGTGLFTPSPLPPPLNGQYEQ